MKYFKKILNLAIALIGLNCVILIHEFGHFIFSKAFDVRTPTFSVGFDPAITYHKFRGTKFQLGAIPLGGYVAINQQDLANRSYPKKMAIIFAGILFNFIFSFCALYYLYKKRYKEHEVEYDDNSYDLQIDDNVEQSLNWRQRIVHFIRKATPEESQKLLQSLSKNRFMGPIGIISAISQSVTLGFDSFLYFLAIISLNIGLFNLLPLSFLDGGQALYFTMQTLFGYGFGTHSWVSYISSTMLALALLFLVLVSIKDIFNLRRSK